MRARHGSGWIPLAGALPPHQAKAFSQEKAHVSLFDHLRGVTKKVEQVDVEYPRTLSLRRRDHGSARTGAAL